MLHKLICENEAELIKELCLVIEKIAQNCICKNNTFTVGFSGIIDFKDVMWMMQVI